MTHKGLDYRRRDRERGGGREEEDSFNQSRKLGAPREKKSVFVEA